MRPLQSCLEQSKAIPRRLRWLRVSQLPFSRGYTYKLLASGALESVLIQSPGAKKGVRLIDGDSLDAYLERLAAEQKGGAK